MNPIAFIAFIMGIQAPAPNTAEKPAPQQTQVVTETKGAVPTGVQAKCGGWDRN